MATTARAVRDTAPATPVPDNMSAKTKHLVDAVRQPFMAFATDFAAITLTRADLSPKFMKAFGAYASDTGGTFIAFVRLIDPTVPADRKAYRAHTSYAAADYLRRLAAATATPRKPIPASKRPATPLVALARMVATVLPLVDPNGKIWDAFVAEMHWTQDTAKRVQSLGAKLGPITLSSAAALSLRKRTGTNG